MADNNGFTGGKFQGNEAGENLLKDWSSLVNFAPAAKYHSGARCVLKINGDVAAFAFGISWTIETQNTEIRTIDNYMPYELAPNIISISGSLNGFHVPGKGASALLIQAQALDFLFHKYITIEVRDSVTDNLLLYVPQAVITSRQETVAVENLTTVVMQWRGVSWKDEIEPNFPSDFTSTANSNPGVVQGLINSVKKLF